MPGLAGCDVLLVMMQHQWRISSPLRWLDHNKTDMNVKGVRHNQSSTMLLENVAPP